MSASIHQPVRIQEWAVTDTAAWRGDYVERGTAIVLFIGSHPNPMLGCERPVIVTLDDQNSAWNFDMESGSDENTESPRRIHPDDFLALMSGR